MLEIIPAEEDLYKILRVRNDASFLEIKKSYFKECRKFHPDKTVRRSLEEQKKDTEKIKELTRAYRIIKDPKKRQEYDLLRKQNPRLDNAEINVAFTQESVDFIFSTLSSLFVSLNISVIKSVPFS